VCWTRSAGTGSTFRDITFVNNDGNSNDLQAIQDLNATIAPGGSKATPGPPIKTEPVDPNELMAKRCKDLVASPGAAMHRVSEMCDDVKLIKVITFRFR